MFRMLSISQRSMLVATIATLPLILSFLTCVAVSTPASAQYGTLYNFRGYPLDGSRPVGALVQDPATAGVYGTTVTGGPWGDGTVYAFSPTSSVGEKLLHTFKGTDGSEVTSTLVVGPNGSALNAALYGTTSSGGKYNKGTVFEVNTDGSGFHVLHNFSGKPDGANPVAGLVMGSDLRLYGTTQKGGAYDQGAVFSLEAYPVTTKLSVLYSFRGATSAAVGDGAHPAARLLNVGTGAFVGTTYDGGKYNLGTVFQLLLTYSSASAKPKVKESILWSFAGGAADGANPAAEVLDLNPESGITRYVGTTVHGGTAGLGTVFDVVIGPAAFNDVLYNFQGGPYDGANPIGAVIQASDGAIYGATPLGGTVNEGTVYMLSPSPAGLWVESIAHSFLGDSVTPTDGANPVSALIDTGDGNLAGTAYAGGNYNNGTIYQLPIVATGT